MDEKLHNTLPKSYNVPMQMAPSDRIAQFSGARQSTFTDIQYHQSPSRRPLSPSAQDLLDYPSLRLYYRQEAIQAAQQQQALAAQQTLQRPLQGFYPNEVDSLEAVKQSKNNPFLQSSEGNPAYQYELSPSRLTYSQYSPQNDPINALNEQYSQLQKAKLEQLKKTQNEALVHQQKIFALRQQLNPPVPLSKRSMSNLDQTSLSRYPSTSGSTNFSVNSPKRVAKVDDGSLQRQTIHKMQQQVQSQIQKEQQQQLSQVQAQTQLQQQVAKQSYLQHQQHQQQQQLQKQQHQLQQQLQQQRMLQSYPQTQQYQPPQSFYGTHLKSLSNNSSPLHQHHHQPYQMQSQSQTQLMSSTNPLPIRNNNQFDSMSFNQHEMSRSLSPVHQTLDRRKKTSASATSTPTKLVKSPQTKRSETSSVTFSGWLYKQGSDGLKVWRKRWFVLCDYCLFYYKGPEEDKLLGSILLPSYRLTECLPDDRNYRKFSFRLEHKNMRTYLLASENGEYMRKWMRVLRAATMMQTFIDPTYQRKSPPLRAKNGSQNLASSFQDLKMRGGSNQPRSYSKSAALIACTDTSLLFKDNDSLEDTDTERQPLYANAPPKPRRSINDAGYFGFANDVPSFRTDYLNDNLASLNTQRPESRPIPEPRRFEDYEDVLYNPNQPDNRAIQLQNHNNDLQGSIGTNPFTNYTPMNLSKKSQYDKSIEQHIESLPPRPRSVDFLEYEARHAKMSNLDPGPTMNKLPSRPKSSLDINSSLDNYYYSEESYADKMRQSAQYLQNRSVMGQQNLFPSTNPFAVSQNFQRSASARFPNFPKENSEPRQDESMKRLMEWKQRMLRSPLTRKDLQNVSQHHMISKSTEQLNLQAQYGNNNYSSDDETLAKASLISNSNASFNKSQTTNSQNQLNILGSNASTLPKTYSRQSDVGSQFGYPSEATTLEDNNVWSLDMSAGALLSRTHEELVLLLIQLRRQSTAKGRAIDVRYKEINNLQNQLENCTDARLRHDCLNRIDKLSHNLSKIERQFEKNKPLINLVDNMVKLGALYHNTGNTPLRNHMNLSMSNMAAIDNNRLEFNHRVQERQLLQSDRRIWNQLNPNHAELQSKVQELYELDQLLQEESETLHILQRDKEDIEGALDELKRKIAADNLTQNMKLSSKKKQNSLEQELSRVHYQLAANSQKLEQTVSGNSKLEQELLMLRQKLQESRGVQRSNSHKTNDTSTAAIENELKRVQELVGDMQRQRQELSMAVRQLTLNSNSIYERLKPKQNQSSSSLLSASSSLLSASANAANKRLHSDWTETDLDNMITKDLECFGGYSHDASTSIPSSPYHSYQSQDIYNITKDENDYTLDSTYDQYNYPDKQEIKTVRIVKRESERRQKDKEKSGSISSSGLEEGCTSFNDYSTSQPRSYNPYDLLAPTQSDNHSYLSPAPALNDPYNITNRSNTLPSRYGSHNFTSLESVNTSCFQSDAARNIITEISEGTNYSQDDSSKYSSASRYKRQTPREKKRHYTAPNTVNSEAMQRYFAGNGIDRNTNWRARDDLDMEVTLRTRTNNSNISGAPDIVRSALGHSENFLNRLESDA